MGEERANTRFQACLVPRFASVFWTLTWWHCNPERNGRRLFHGTRCAAFPAIWTRSWDSRNRVGMGRQGIGKSKRRAGQPEYSSTQVNVQRTDVNLGHRAKAPSFQKPWSSTVDYRFRIEPSLLSNQPFAVFRQVGDGGSPKVSDPHQLSTIRCNQPATGPRDTTPPGAFGVS
jgi:hypothetical protein